MIGRLSFRSTLMCLYLCLGLTSSVPLFAANELTTEHIKELILPNGLKIIFKPDHRSPIAALQIWYRLGSADEDKTSSGISHLLEHMMFKAGRNKVLAESFHHLNTLGAQGNAYTSRDYSYFYHLLDKKYLELAFKVEAERMQNLSPTQNDFDIEKKVVIEEMHTRKAKDPYLAAHHKLYELACKNKGYEFPVIGREEAVKDLTFKQTMSWYKNHYRPENATIVVVGDVSERSVFTLARKYFSTIDKVTKEAVPELAEKKPLADKKPLEKSVENTSTNIERRYTMPATTKVGALLMAFKVPSIKTSNPLWEAYALEILAGWLESGDNSRLTKALIRDKKLAHEINVIYSPMMRQDDLFIIEIMPAINTSLLQLEQVLIAEIKKIKQELISSSVLQKIKNQMIAVEIFDRDSIETQAKILGQAEAVGIHWSEDAQYLTRIKAITAKQVQQVADKYLNLHKSIIVLQNSSNSAKSPRSGIDLLKAAIKPLKGLGDNDAVLKMIADKNIVLLGDSTHGSHEFYQQRINISKRLIQEKGFKLIALEGDWPNVHLLNRYIHSATSLSAVKVLDVFNPNAAWLWNNREMLHFIQWLKNYNDQLGANEKKVSLYGMDIYTFEESRKQVIEYLQRYSYQAAEQARWRYQCFDLFDNDLHRYGRAVSRNPSLSCEYEVVTQYQDFSECRIPCPEQYALLEREAFFSAWQNARVVKNVEASLRLRYMNNDQSAIWNQRDLHMLESLQAFSQHLHQPKLIVWAHNSHLGDARATEMVKSGLLNIGQLLREHYPEQVFSIGMLTHSGTVMAADDWHKPAKIKSLLAVHPETNEAIFHRLGINHFALNLHQSVELQQFLNQPKLQRHVGVVYKPENEMESHYSYTFLADQFDAIIYIDQTSEVLAIKKNYLMY